MASTIIDHSSMTGWSGSTTSWTVSGGYLYSTASLTSTLEITYPFRVTSGSRSRVVCTIRVDRSGWPMIGVYSATRRFGVGCDNLTPKYYWSPDGAITAFSGAASMTHAADATCVIQSDEQGVSVSIQDDTGAYYTLFKTWTEMAGDLTGIFIIGRDADTTAGARWGPIGMESTGATISPRTGIEGLRRTFIGTRTSSTAVTATERSLICLPASYDSTRQTHLVVHCHGATKDEREAFGTSPNIGPTTQALLDAGYVVAAGSFFSTGGSADAFGSPAAVAWIEELVSYCRAHFNVDKVLFTADSMGNLGVLNVIARRSVTGIAGWVGTEPAIDLHTEDGGTWWRTSSTGVSFGSAFRAAYGIASDYSDLRTQASASNPIIRSASSYAGLKGALWASYSDTTASRTENADAFATLVAGVATLTVNTATGNHNDPSHYVPSAVVTFATAAFAAATTTAPRLLSLLGVG